jgi:hypothetical protein
MKHEMIGDITSLFHLSISGQQTPEEAIKEETCPSGAFRR